MIQGSYSAFVEFSTVMKNVNLAEKWTKFEDSKEMNLQFVFLSIYTRTVKRLLAFIEASRTRNWIQDLSPSQDLMQDLIAMDRCKYRKDVWNNFLDRNFSVQKCNIPGVVIGCDHADEHVNSEDKSRGGLKGITRNDNSRIRHYLAALTLAQISEQLQSQANPTTSADKLHQQLSKSYTNRQSERVLSLLSTLQEHELM